MTCAAGQSSGWFAADVVVDHYARRVLFALLGPLEVDVGARRIAVGRRRERCLLAVLLLELGRVVPAERLIELLWEDDPPPQARRALHVHVARLRTVLVAGGGDGVRLETAGAGYVLHADPQAVDVHRFRALVAQAHGEHSAEQRATLHRAALSLWRGPVLADIASDRLRERICGELEELRLRCLEDCLATELDLGRHSELVAELSAAVQANPYRERLRALLMLSLYRAGRQVEALEVFRKARSLLVEQFGVEPGPELRRLHEAVLRGDPSLDRVGVADLDGHAGVAAPTPTPDAAPVRTPRQLPADVAGFVGREDELSTLDERVDKDPSHEPATLVISALAGTAGVGKTALAVHWAHTVAARFPDGQLYVNLRGFDPGGSVMSPAEAIRGFLDALEVPSSVFRSGLRRRRRCTEACSPTNVSWSFWTTPATPRRSGRYCRARRAASRS